MSSKDVAYGAYTILTEVHNHAESLQDEIAVRHYGRNIWRHRARYACAQWRLMHWSAALAICQYWYHYEEKPQ